MEPFEYVAVLVSLILGIGITQLLTGLANLIHRYDHVTFYAPHVIWIILVFGFHLQEWWINYEYSQVIKEWRLSSFFLMITYPIVLFIMARMLFPSSITKGKVDLKKFYFKNHRKFFLVGLFLPLISIPQNVLLSGLGIEEQFVQMFVALILLLGALANSKNQLIHYFIAIITFVLGMGYMFIYDPVL